jgi:hypothetical protein
MAQGPTEVLEAQCFEKQNYCPSMIANLSFRVNAQRPFCKKNPLLRFPGNDGASSHIQTGFKAPGIHEYPGLQTEVRIEFEVLRKTLFYAQAANMFRFVERKIRRINRTHRNNSGNRPALRVYRKSGRGPPRPSCPRSTIRNSLPCDLSQSRIVHRSSPIVNSKFSILVDVPTTTGKPDANNYRPR